jgi:hypothetical protein
MIRARLFPPFPPLCQCVSFPLLQFRNFDDPANRTWTLTGSMNTARELHTATHQK